MAYQQLIAGKKLNFPVIYHFDILNFDCFNQK